MDIPLSHLAHLTRPGNFHPLPPPATPLELPPPSTPISSLLASGHFRAAALLSARQLAAPPSVQAPLNAAQVLALWHIRLASLSLLAFEHLASDEARALGDAVDGEVYRSPVDGESIVPWGLRVLAVRLQARAEGDLGRAVIAMHVLAREARRRARQIDEDTTDERRLWGERLADLHVRIVSLLVELGDLEGAERLLQSGKVSVSKENTQQHDLLSSRLFLLYLHIGNIAKAKETMAEAETDRSGMTIALKPLLGVSEGEHELGEEQTDDEAALQNLAIHKLYSGDLTGAKNMLADAVERGLRFPTLLFNLSTIFELRTDRAKELKMGLGKHLGSRDDTALGAEHSVTDLKV